MKKFAGLIIAVVTFILCFTLCACVTRYRSNFSAKSLASKNTSTTASVSFDSFSGTYVIKWNENVSGDVFITYEATLSEGNIKVYYDFNEEKLDLFEIKSDGRAEGKTDAFKGDKIIYIVIESDGNCKDGSFSFALEKSGK